MNELCYVNMLGLIWPLAPGSWGWGLSALRLQGLYGASAGEGIPWYTEQMLCRPLVLNPPSWPWSV